MAVASHRASQRLSAAVTPPKGRRRMIQTITTTDALAAFCTRAAARPYVTVDTEFLRERTYWSQLCLVQLAVPGDAPEDAVLVDPLSGGVSLDPLYALFRDPSVVKVFHAARQDLEIFSVEGGVIPAPLFDTQVAAMVCGYGDQAGYETLVKRIAHQSVDKTSRFTDWSRRPLTEAQAAYALADVTHLRVIYEHLAAELARTGRTVWLAEEMAVLQDPATYRVEPAEAWRRVKTRTGTGRFMAIVRELARFREVQAQTANVPRARVFKDDVLLEIASLKPATDADLGRSRLLQREGRRGDVAAGILAAVKAGVEADPADFPEIDRARERIEVNPALADLLRVLLKARSEGAGVAPRLLANASDLDALAAGERDLPALRGWRADVFGDDALRLCDGRIALAVRGSEVVVVPMPASAV
jgi:ribonuclease D